MFAQRHGQQLALLWLCSLSLLIHLCYGLGQAAWWQGRKEPPQAVLTKQQRFVPEDRMKTQAPILHLSSFGALHTLSSSLGCGTQRRAVPWGCSGAGGWSCWARGLLLPPPSLPSSQSHFRRVLFHCCLPDNVTESFN